MSATYIATNTIVTIEEVRVSAFVGLHAPERSTPQIVLVDIDCVLDTPAVKGDDLSQSIDYVPIVAAVQSLAQTHRRRLIETFAQEIAEICFSNNRVRECQVRIRKPHKFPSCSSVGVSRTFVRKE